MKSQMFTSDLLHWQVFLHFLWTKRSHVTSPVLIEAINFLLVIIQLHVQLIVKATAAVTTEDAEQGKIFKSLYSK